MLINRPAFFILVVLPEAASNTDGPWPLGFATRDVTDNQFFIPDNIDPNFPPFSARLNADECANVEHWLRVQSLLWL